MSSLDDKLKEILTGVRSHSDMQGSFDPVVYVPAIKQAFTDEGYVQLAYNPVKKELLGKPVGNNLSTNNLMTGQEWYNRFEKEGRGQMFPYRTDREMELVAATAHFFSNAAKRAGGIE